MLGIGGRRVYRLCGGRLSRISFANFVLCGTFLCERKFDGEETGSREREREREREEKESGFSSSLVVVVVQEDFEEALKKKEKTKKKKKKKKTFS